MGKDHPPPANDLPDQPLTEGWCEELDSEGEVDRGAQRTSIGGNRKKGVGKVVKRVGSFPEKDKRKVQ